MRLFKVFGYSPAIMVPRAVSLLVVVVFTRLLEPDQFGMYSLILVYGGLLDAVFLNWSRLGLLRFYHWKQGESLGEIMPGSMIVLVGGLVIGGFSGVLLIICTESTSSVVFFQLLMLYFVANGLLCFGLNILRAREQQLAYVALEVFRPVMGFIAAWICVKTLGNDYIRLSQGLFGVTALFGVALMAYTMRGFVWKRADWKAFKEMMRYAAPLLLVFFWVNFITASDRFFLNYLSGPVAVGMYSANYALARPIIEVLFNVINLGEFPKLIKAFEQEGSKAAQEILKKTVGYLMFLCLPSLTGLFLLAEPLSSFMVGVEYREGAPLVIRIVAIGAFFAGLKSFVFDQIFHLHRKSMIQSLTLIPGALLSIVLNLLLIPSYGAAGAASAGLMGYILAAFLSFIYSRRYLKILWPVRELVWVGFASVLMGITIQVIQRGPEPKRLIYSFPAACVVYFVICWQSGVFRIFNYASKTSESNLK